MGDLKVSEVFQDAIFIIEDSSGLGKAGLSPTCTFVKISDNTRTAGTVQEVGSGWYRVTDFQADAVGAWTTEWSVAGAYTIHLAFKIFKAGAGQILDIFDRIGSPAGASIAADLLAIDNFVDGIEADIGVFPSANYATFAAYVEDIRTRLIAIVGDTNELQVSLANGGFTDLLIDAIKAKTDNLPVDPADASDIATAHALLATEAKQDIIDTNVDTLITRVTAAVALASVLGALNDAAGQDADSNAFTVMQHLKGLHDVLWDADGVAVFPAAAAPANGISLAKVLRAVYDDTNMLQTDWVNGGRLDNLLDAIPTTAMRGTDSAATVADGWDAALATILDNFSAARIGYLDELDFDLDARLGSPAGASISADLLTIDNFVDDLETRLTAARAGYFDRLQGYVNKTTFWSNSQEEVAITGGAGDVNLPDVVLPNITGTIVRVYVAFKFRMVENTNAGANKLNGAQSIRIKASGGAWGTDDVAAIDFVDDQFSIAASTREGGDVLIGDNEVSSEVTAFNDTYNIRWEDGVADLANLNFNDVQAGLIVEWY